MFEEKVWSDSFLENFVILLQTISFHIEDQYTLLANIKTLKLYFP